MIHTSEDLWGPDAGQFDPDRFIDERKQRLINNPFMFVPFNAGPRICLGQQVRLIIPFYQQSSRLTSIYLARLQSHLLHDNPTAPELYVFHLC